MTNTGYATRQTTSTRTLILTVMAMLFALSLSLLAAQRPASASTTFTVNTTSDLRDGNLADNLCDAKITTTPFCTLRAAIEQANATPGADAIDFDIPYSGVQTIHVNSSGYGELPTITDKATIDGYSQRPCSSNPAPCSHPNTLTRGTNAKLMIQLEGSTLSSISYGLRIDAPEVVVKGLVINRFNDGIEVGGYAANTRIEGNFLGAYPSGTKAPGIPNGYQSAFTGGVHISDAGGITNNTVGGPIPAARNLISGNRGGSGVLIGGFGNQVYGNLIGTQRDGESPLGNFSHGVYIFGSNDAVGGVIPGYANTIAFNGGTGVQTGPFTKTGNTIFSNSIFSNKELGIDLDGDGKTANDPEDADTGPNNLQNYPMLSSAKKPTPAKTVVKGKLNSRPNETFKVQFFSNPEGTDEGKTFLFSRSVTTDSSGNVSFTFATKKRVGLGQNITATATKDSTGDTSEFSAPRKVVES